MMQHLQAMIQMYCFSYSKEQKFHASWNKGKLFLQVISNGIQHCHTKLQDLLHRLQVLVIFVQETRLYVNSTLNWLWTCHSRPPLRPLQGA